MGGAFAFLALIVLTLAPSMGLAKPSGKPQYSAIVIEAKTGEVLYARRADSERYPASLTKIMTLYLAFDALEAGQIKLTDKIKISRTAARQPPSKLGLPAGRTITVDQAIRAIAVKSSNDIAVAMAEFLGGSESRFAAIMTIKARELGMKRTRFVNASGLPDERQISTARDMAILSRSIMRDHPKYYGYFSAPTFEWRGAELRNHNRLLQNADGVDGIKTGFTNASGFNLAASAVREGKRVIAVVIGGRTSRTRDAHMEELLDKTFAVLDRRQRGERAAQLATMALEEPDAIGHLIDNPIEQGSAEGEVPRVLDRRLEEGDATPRQFLPHAPTSGHSLAEVAARLEAEPKMDDAPQNKQLNKPQSVASRGQGLYSIQIGAFDTRRDAQNQLSHIQDRHRRVLADSYSLIMPVQVKGRTFYRARFVGFGPSEARQACEHLKAEKHNCLALAAQ